MQVSCEHCGRKMSHGDEYLELNTGYKCLVFCDPRCLYRWVTSPMFEDEFGEYPLV